MMGSRRRTGRGSLRLAGQLARATRRESGQPLEARRPRPAKRPVPTPFSITSVSLDGEALLTLTGELDATTVAQVQDLLDAATANCGTVILNLTQLRFIDSSGIRALVLASRESRRDGFDLRLTGSTPAVMRALELVGVLDELPFIKIL